MVMIGDMPGKFRYQPVMTEEELEDYLAGIEDPEEHKKEEKRLRKLRKEYLDFQKYQAEKAEDILLG